MVPENESKADCINRLLKEAAAHDLDLRTAEGLTAAFQAADRQRNLKQHLLDQYARHEPVAFLEIAAYAERFDGGVLFEHDHDKYDLHFDNHAELLDTNVAMRVQVSPHVAPDTALRLLMRMAASFERSFPESNSQDNPAGVDTAPQSSDRSTNVVMLDTIHRTTEAARGLAEHLPCRSIDFDNTAGGYHAELVEDLQEKLAHVLQICDSLKKESST